MDKETIDLDIDEANELLFKVKVEGVAPAPAKVRLVCEVDDVGYIFQGHATQEEGVVQFVLPPMKGKLSEGLYSSKVEVLVENRYFAPVQFNINFKQTVKVVAEAVKIPVRPVPAPIKVMAAAVQVQKPTVVTPAPPKPELRPAIIQGPPAKPAVTEQAKVEAAPPPKAPVPVQPARKASPRANTGSTLKERYTSKVEPQKAVVEELADEVGEDLLRELAQEFVTTRRRK